MSAGSEVHARMNHMSGGEAPNHEFYASCPAGFERALARELKRLGLWRVRQLKGRVSFEGPALAGERACLHSRLASRVYVLLGRCPADDADALYEGVYQLPWESILRPYGSISITAAGSNNHLRNSRYTALLAKDALSDRLADKTGARAIVDTEHPDARVRVAIKNGRASIHLDLSGQPLFARLPRAAMDQPASGTVLRPDYAALALEELGWAEACWARDRHGDGALARPLLVDAACAGGGIELEAVSMLLGRAPGLDRKAWGFTAWREHDPAAWDELLRDARLRNRESEGLASPQGEAPIIASDPDSETPARAKRMLERTGNRPWVRLLGANELPDAIDAVRAGNQAGQSELGDSAPLVLAVADLTAVSLPRMHEAAAVIAALEARGCSRMVTLSQDAPLGSLLGRRPRRSIDILPHNEQARLDVWENASALKPGSVTAAATAPFKSGEEDMRPEAPAAGDNEASEPKTLLDLGNGRHLPLLVAASEQFAARLRKVARLRRRWAARTGVTCYRVYDADLPDYAAAIDLYEGAPATPGRWLVIAEYAAPKTIDPAIAQARFLDILAIAPLVLDVDPAHVYARARIRSRGGSQYGKAAAASRETKGAPQVRPLIEEGGLTFCVNFDDYLDTGIFLDHRITRSLVRERARQARFFLNLFAYTGTATCYAADAGVEETVTVDLSNTYLDWAERNMELNGFTGRRHHFVRADVLAWIEDQIDRGNQWDLIFCDPPTFSNSAKMGRRTWDVQRDHVGLLANLARLLLPGGQAIFSCNLRTFRPDIEGLARAGVAIEDITAQTIPEDFSRNKRIHKCYVVRRAREERPRE